MIRFLVLGSDTTANALQYSFVFIVHHRNVYDRLSQELINAFPDSEVPLDFQILGSLPYLNAVISEALRLGMPLSGLERITPPSGTTVDGIFIPGNTIVSVPAYAQQLDPTNFFPDPEDFRPERWLPGGLGPGTILEPNALMSFSFGSSLYNYLHFSAVLIYYRSLRMYRKVSRNPGVTRGDQSASPLLHHYISPHFRS